MLKAAAGAFGLLGGNFRQPALTPQESANGLNVLYRNRHTYNIRIR